MNRDLEGTAFILFAVYVGCSDKELHLGCWRSNPWVAGCLCAVVLYKAGGTSSGCAVLSTHPCY